MKLQDFHKTLESLFFFVGDVKYGFYHRESPFFLTTTWEDHMFCWYFEAQRFDDETPVFSGGAEKKNRYP